MFSGGKKQFSTTSEGGIKCCQDRTKKPSPTYQLQGVGRSDEDCFCSEEQDFQFCVQAKRCVVELGKELQDTLFTN